jgi:hypothetical protein
MTQEFVALLVAYMSEAGRKVLAPSWPGFQGRAHFRIEIAAPGHMAALRHAASASLLWSSA